MTQQYDTEYLSQAIDEEIELLLLDRKIVVRKPSVVWRDSPLYEQREPYREGRWCGFAPAPLPAFRRNQRDAGALAIKHALSVRHDYEECTVTVGYGTGRRGVTEHYGAHPDRDAAIMAAITRAAIQMLTEQRDEAAALYPTRATSRRRPGARAKTTK
ncbi:hypothetical protein [Massilia sp. HP4]|uniref:hypothetical protein n=1 Tax=Massilia sp. HP4 TaxID=2562316 RepID=UPI0010C0BB10|nr:hypothetical protein [Massilia sp. HP4]